MAHYDLGLYISHHWAENGHCGMDRDSLIILFLVAFIFLFQARPCSNIQLKLSAQIFAKSRTHKQNHNYTSKINIEISRSGCKFPWFKLVLHHCLSRWSIVSSTKTMVRPVTDSSHGRMTDLKEKRIQPRVPLMLHHLKGKRPSTRDVLSQPMAFEIHFLTFVLVLKLVEYSDTSRGKKKKKKKRREKERKQQKRLCI